MKNKNVLSIYQGLQSCANLTGVKFAYAIAKNIYKIKTEIEIMNETLKASENYRIYDKKRSELAEKNAEKNKDGTPKSTINKTNGQEEFVIGDKKAFEKELEALKEEYKEEIEKREEQIKSYQDFLEEESPLELHRINSEELPKEITAGQLSSIMEIVDESNSIK